MRRCIPIETYSGRAAKRILRKRRRRSHLGRALVILGAVCLLVAGGAWAWNRLELHRLGLPSAVAETPERSAAVETATPDATAPAPPKKRPAPSAVATSALGPLLPPELARPATITVAAVGDMLFDRRIKRFIESSGGEAPLAAVAARLSAADVAVGNLEGPLGTTGRPVAGKEYTFRGHPDAIAGLKAAGFDALSLANNHTLDYGKDPLQETIRALDAAGIGYAGAGPDAGSAWKPATIERPHARIAFLAYTHVLPPGFLAGANRWGVASGRMDPSLMDAAIKRAKKDHDYVIVSFHWGVEYKDDANAEQVRWGRRAIDSGADMVLAHHPHVIQGVEFYKRGLIAYSLGDFVWDHHSPKTGEAFILEAELGPHGVANAVALPVYLQPNTGKPEFVTGSKSDTILGRLKKIDRKSVV